MTTTNDSLKLAELLKTPICKIDGEELAFLITSITSNQQAQMLLTQPKQEEHNVYGIAGIAQIFGCGGKGLNKQQKYAKIQCEFLELSKVV